MDLVWFRGLDSYFTYYCSLILQSIFGLFALIALIKKVQLALKAIAALFLLTIDYLIAAVNVHRMYL